LGFRFSVSGILIPPELAVEGAVLEGLGEVFAGDFVCAREVGDRPFDLQNAVAGLSHGGVR